PAAGRRRGGGPGHLRRGGRPRLVDLGRGRPRHGPRVLRRRRYLPLLHRRRPRSRRRPGEPPRRLRRRTRGQRRGHRPRTREDRPGTRRGERLMSDAIEEPNWQDSAPTQSPTVGEDGAWAPSGTDAWKAVTGQGSPSAKDNGTSGMNMLGSVASPLNAVQSTVTNAGKIDGLTDWDGYTNLITGLAGSISGIQGAAENFWGMVEGITDPKFDPVQWLAGTLIDFMIQVFQPLEDLVGMVSGNESRMRTSSSMWNAVSGGAPQVADYVQSIGEEHLSDW